MYSRLAWGYCLENQVRISAVSQRYTPEFIAEQISLTDAAELLPTLKMRRGEASLANRRLAAQNQTVRDMLQLLKGFIQVAYPVASLAAVELRAAGLDKFSSANNNWGNTEGMIRSAKQYMASNTEILANGDNMPREFPTDFAAAAAAFNANWQEYIGKEKAVTDGTGTQDAALEPILEQLNQMLRLGRRTFKYEPLLRMKFTISDLLDEVRRKHQAGLQGIVSLETTSKPQGNVRVQVVGVEEKFAITDSQGHYQLLLPAGTYSLSFTSDGTVPFIVENKVVKPGVQGRLSVSLQPVPLAVAVETPTIAAAPSTEELLATAMGGVEVEEAKVVVG